jgi:hypothetical protein
MCNNLTNLSLKCVRYIRVFVTNRVRYNRVSLYCQKIEDQFCSFLWFFFFFIRSVPAWNKKGKKSWGFFDSGNAAHQEAFTDPHSLIKMDIKDHFLLIFLLFLSFSIKIFTTLFCIYKVKFLPNLSSFILLYCHTFSCFISLFFYKIKF